MSTFLTQWGIRLTLLTSSPTSKIQRPDILTKYGRQLIQSGAVGGIEGDQKNSTLEMHASTVTTKLSISKRAHQI